jgi:hypothetical protein
MLAQAAGARREAPYRVVADRATLWGAELGAQIGLDGSSATAGGGVGWGEPSGIVTEADWWERQGRSDIARRHEHPDPLAHNSLVPNRPGHPDRNSARGRWQYAADRRPGRSAEWRPARPVDPRGEISRQDSQCAGRGPRRPDTEKSNPDWARTTPASIVAVLVMTSFTERHPSRIVPDYAIVSGPGRQSTTGGRADRQRGSAAGREVRGQRGLTRDQGRRRRWPSASPGARQCGPRGRRGRSWRSA